MQRHATFHGRPGRWDDFQQRPRRPHRLLPVHRAATRPPGERAVADEFVQLRPVFLHDAAAFVTPETDGSRQFRRGQPGGEVGEPLQIRHQQHHLPGFRLVEECGTGLGLIRC